MKPRSIASVYYVRLRLVWSTEKPNQKRRAQLPRRLSHRSRVQLYGSGHLSLVIAKAESTAGLLSFFALFNSSYKSSEEPIYVQPSFLLLVFEILPLQPYRLRPRSGSVYPAGQFIVDNTLSFERSSISNALLQ